MAGRLYGVGVGPGDPELMTIKACKIIRNCPDRSAGKGAGGDSGVSDRGRS